MEIFNQSISNNTSFNYYICLYPFIISVLISTFLVPRCLSIGKNLNLYDFPGKRKIHNKPIVRSGGIALFIAFIVPTLIFSSFIDINTEIIYVISGGSLIFFLIGLFDDFYNISPYIKLCLQIIFTFFLFFLGIKIIGLNLSEIYLSNRVIILPETISIIITTIWIVGITNSINWIDGLDGLASGTAIIFSIGVLLISLMTNQAEFIIISSSILGSNIGFLKHNFNPAKIIMGDSGSYFLGFSLAVLSLDLSSKGEFEFISLKSFLLLALPLIDLTTVTFNRLLNGKNPFRADKNHMHHRLLMKIKDQKYTVLILYFISLIFTFLAVLISSIKI